MSIVLKRWNNKKVSIKKYWHTHLHISHSSLFTCLNIWGSRYCTDFMIYFYYSIMWIVFSYIVCQTIVKLTIHLPHIYSTHVWLNIWPKYVFGSISNKTFSFKNKEVFFSCASKCECWHFLCFVQVCNLVISFTWHPHGRHYMNICELHLEAFLHVKCLAVNLLQGKRLFAVTNQDSLLHLYPDAT